MIRGMALGPFDFTQSGGSSRTIGTIKSDGCDRSGVGLVETSQFQQKVSKIVESRHRERLGGQCSAVSGFCRHRIANFTQQVTVSDGESSMGGPTHHGGSIT